MCAPKTHKTASFSLPCHSLTDGVGPKHLLHQLRVDAVHGLARGTVDAGVVDDNVQLGPLDLCCFGVCLVCWAACQRAGRRADGLAQPAAQNTATTNVRTLSARPFAQAATDASSATSTCVNTRRSAPTLFCSFCSSGESRLAAATQVFLRSGARSCRRNCVRVLGGRGGIEGAVSAAAFDANAEQAPRAPSAEPRRAVDRLPPLPRTSHLKTDPLAGASRDCDRLASDWGAHFSWMDPSSAPARCVFFYAVLTLIDIRSIKTLIQIDQNKLSINLAEIRTASSLLGRSNDARSHADTPPLCDLNGSVLRRRRSRRDDHHHDGREVEDRTVGQPGSSI